MLNALHMELRSAGPPICSLFVISSLLLVPAGAVSPGPVNLHAGQRVQLCELIVAGTRGDSSLHALHARLTLRLAAGAGAGTPHDLASHNLTMT